MRLIRKTDPPPELMAWLARQPDPSSASWDAEDLPKRAVRESLVREQWGLCCYCGKRITTDDSHVDHFRPQHCFRHLQVEYGNLHASCQRDGEADGPPAEREPSHCGSAKKGWFDPVLLVSPLDPECGTYFRFDGEGRIRPSTDQGRRAAGQETINRLGLHHPWLCKQRKDQLDAFWERFSQAEEEIGTDAAVERILDDLRTPSAVGNLPPFCFVVESVLFYQ